MNPADPLAAVHDPTPPARAGTVSPRFTAAAFDPDAIIVSR